MAQSRPTGAPCPIDEAPLGMDKCQPCRYFRGAALVEPRQPNKPFPWSIVCNWPRNGSDIMRATIPDVFTEAKWDG